MKTIKTMETNILCSSYMENKEERFERNNGNKDIMQFLDAVNHHLGEQLK